MNKINLSKANDIMLKAINVARTRVGFTGFNPCVCAIATDEDFNILQISTTSNGGRPHAERSLIESLTKNNTFKKNSLYLFTTLEPCSHFGKTPPCADFIIESDLFKAVFISSMDKDERVMGLGIKKLQSAGIETYCDILSDLSSEFLYREYFYARSNKMPFVTAKLAVSIDGKIATKTFDSKWLSSPETKRYTDFLRHKYDGILVGKNTYIKDSPQLSSKIDDFLDIDPKKFVISSDESFLKTLRSDVISINHSKQGDLGSVLKKIYSDYEINHLLVEGGAKTITEFIKQGLVNRLVIIKCPIIIGSDGINGFDSLDIDKLTDCKPMSLSLTKVINNDVILVYELL